MPAQKSGPVGGETEHREAGDPEAEPDDQGGALAEALHGAADQAALHDHGAQPDAPPA